MSTNNIILKSDEFKQFMLLMLVADQIHDFTDKNRIKNPSILKTLQYIFDQIQSVGMSVSGGNSYNFTGGSGSRLSQSTRRRRPPTRHRSQPPPRRPPYSAPPTRRRSLRRSLPQPRLPSLLATPPRQPPAASRPKPTIAWASASPTAIATPALAAQPLPPPDAAATISAAATKEINKFCDEINKLNTSLMTHHKSRLMTHHKSRLMTHPKSRKKKTTLYSGIHKKSRKKKPALDTLTDHVYHDGDVALYLLQLLGSFNDNKIIIHEYTKSQGDFFKFFKELIKQYSSMDGGGGVKRSGDQLAPSDQKKAKIDEEITIKKIITNVKDKIIFYDEGKLENNFKRQLNINNENKQNSIRKITGYKSDLSNIVVELTNLSKNTSTVLKSDFKTSVHFCQVITEDNDIKKYCIDEFITLLEKKIEVINHEINVLTRPTVSSRRHSVPADIGILATKIIKNLEIKEFKCIITELSLFVKSGNSAIKTQTQIEGINEIGKLIKNVAHIIVPTSTPPTTSPSPSPLAKLFDICTNGGNIEEKIKQFVLVKYKQSDIPSTPISSINKAVIINNGSNKFSKLKEYCIYTDACRIDAGSRECSIKEEGTMNLKISCNSSTSTSDYIDVLLEENGNNFDVKFEFKLEGFTGDYTYKDNDNEITLQKVYIEVLKLFLERIAKNNFTWPAIGKPEDKEFIGNFIATYSIKTLGDFLQEVNAGIKGGGYTRPPNYPSVSSAKVPERIASLDSEVNRIYMVNDKLSYCRFLVMKSLFPDTATNKNSHAILDTQGTGIDKINLVLKHYGIPEISYT